MASTDPLIKSLKYLIEEFHSSGVDIDDNHPYLASFCQALEHSLTQGIKIGKYNAQKENGQSYRRKKFWELLESFQTNGPTPMQLSPIIRIANERKSLRHGDGKFRYFIRSCLSHRIVHVVLEFLMTRKQHVMLWYEEEDERYQRSIITKEHLMEQLKSLFLVVSNSLVFNLNLNNDFFLDETWVIPKLTHDEFVPALELGIGLIYIDGYCVITNIKPGSVVSDSKAIGVGDILVSMNNQLLFPGKQSGDNSANEIWQVCRQNAVPCKIEAIKARCPSTGSIFTPIKKAITEYQVFMKDFNIRKQLELDKLSEQQESVKARQLSPRSWEQGNTPVMHGKTDMDVYKAKYIGEVLVGECGGMGRVESVIKQAINKQSSMTSLNVLIEVNEISVVVKSAICKSSNCQTTSQNSDSAETSCECPNNILFTHKFSDISSCGKTMSHECYFCYIAGDTFCTISQQFKGYVFLSKTPTHAKLILNNIYQGFKRTTWFM